VTSQEQKTAQSADRDIPDTKAIPVSAPAPVFVDSTGRRRRLLRRLAYAFGGLCMAYGGLISVSLAGGPVSSSAILPLPDLGEGGTALQGRPSPTPQPPTAVPKARAIIEALPRRGLPPTRNDRPWAFRPTTASVVPRATGEPAPTAHASATARPVESATTTTPSPSPSASASPSASSGPTTGPARPPVHSVPPKTGTSGGSPAGGAGGSATGGTSGTGGSTAGGTGGTGGSTAGGTSGTGASTSGDGASRGSGGTAPLPVPPTQSSVPDEADSTPAPSPQAPADAEVPA
jgi:hypothetical protein